jgi:hypothetical protein
LLLSLLMPRVLLLVTMVLTGLSMLWTRQIYPPEPLNVQASVSSYDLDNLKLDTPGMPRTIHVQFLVKDVLVGGQCNDAVGGQPPNGLQVRCRRVTSHLGVCGGGHSVV